MKILIQIIFEGWFEFLCSESVVVLTNVILQLMSAIIQFDTPVGELQV